jgi:Putative Actinobacterial Holin-X, holin superfamily III
MTDTVHTAASSSPADDGESPQEQEHEAREPEDTRSLTELLEQLGRELGELGMSEAQLEAARNMPEIRRAARDIAGALVVVIAALTAFTFLNVAALDALSRALPTWGAALVLAAAWIAVAVILFGFMRRARRWLLWIVLKAPPAEAVDELKRERDAAGKAALSTIERIGPALAIQIALATVPDAGDVAGGVVEVGETVLEFSDEFVEVATEQLPGGGVVNQVWDVALMPGRFGIKVATTVLRRGRPPAD